ncbi:MAG: hypothetical protein ACRD0O_18775, partial [Acidimicrobiia bacterium]
GGQVATADRPGETAGAAAPAMVTADYTVLGSAEGADRVEARFRLTTAADGSFRWTGQNGASDTRDGIQDVAYDAAAHRAVQIADRKPDGGLDAYVTTDIPSGGPDQGFAVVEPLGPVADFVVSLARAGDPRVTEADHPATGRPVWRYEGPLVEDRLGDGPDRVVAEADRATGVLLTLRSSARGTAFRDLSATSVETAGEIDRSRFQIEIAPSAETSRFSMGFQPASLEKARVLMPFDVLVPDDGAIPEGFDLDAVAVNRDRPSVTGAEGMNPPVADIVVLHWRKGFGSFTLTLRPTSGQPWDDPFGSEGMVYRTIPVKAELPGRPTLGGDLIVDPPARPHLWGITGDIVVTVDGDLTPEEFLRLAESLRG